MASIGSFFLRIRTGDVVSEPCRGLMSFHVTVCTPTQRHVLMDVDTHRRQTASASSSVLANLPHVYMMLSGGRRNYAQHHLLDWMLPEQRKCV